jgi:hypothetical protein
MPTPYVFEAKKDGRVVAQIVFVPEEDGGTRRVAEPLPLAGSREFVRAFEDVLDDAVPFPVPQGPVFYGPLDDRDFPQVLAALRETLKRLDPPDEADWSAVPEGFEDDEPEDPEADY